MPLHRILYHLEALSSRLMPSANDPTIQQNAEIFLQDFLKANGLEVLTSLLKLESFKSHNDYETKQDIYILLLQLLRLIFFGSYYPLSSAHQMGQSNHKRPSTEPITTCAKKTVTPAMLISGSQGNETNTKWNSNIPTDPSMNSESKILNVIQKMSINEMIELISQLLVIFWSAAAGNMELTAGNTHQAAMSPSNWEDPNSRSPRISSMSPLSTSNKTLSSFQVIINLIHLDLKHRSFKFKQMFIKVSKYFIYLFI